MAAGVSERRDDLGAWVGRDATEFRVWAPRARAVEVLIESAHSDPPVKLEPESGGYFSGSARGVGAGALYRFRLDGEHAYPDPCSRFQPEGPHGPSLIVDPAAYAWKDHDRDRRGFEIRGQILYELHIGTFTQDGTFDAAARRLTELRDLGVTLLEVMPVAESAGRWNWGYDGVDLFAPSHHYGDPQAMKRFVDAAHALGIGVMLDVVYNHLGPEGNYLTAFSDAYFTDRDTDWGAAFNFDGADSAPVREYFIHNARYWVEEFHLDGLRLDATQDIHDSSPVHILAEIGAAARRAAGGRKIVVIGENEPQQVRLIQKLERGGYGLDGVWSDDFHHAARVALTGRREAYYTDYRGTPQELISAVKRGYLFQGQRYGWQDQGRGSAVTDEPAWAFVHYLQNHDQVANSLHGTRLHEDAGLPRTRAMTALLLLAPPTPMLFMGQEFASSRHFFYFTDQKEAERQNVAQGREEFLDQFAGAATPAAHAVLRDPSDPAIFQESKLEEKRTEAQKQMLALHRDLIALRKSDPVISRQDRFRFDGAVLAADAFVLRWFGDEAGDRLLLVNLGAETALDPVPEPLLAPRPDSLWKVQWGSEHPRYGGAGIPAPLAANGSWRLPGLGAVLLRSAPRPAATPTRKAS